MKTNQTYEKFKEISYEDFLRIELRVGTVIEAYVNQKARKPSYVLDVDFGPYGIRTTSAQITSNYVLEELVGRQVIAVMNFPPKQIAEIKSEVLLLGANSAKQNVVLLQLTHPVENGSLVA